MYNVWESIHLANCVFLWKKHIPVTMYILCIYKNLVYVLFGAEDRSNWVITYQSIFLYLFITSCWAAFISVWKILLVGMTIRHSDIHCSCRIGMCHSPWAACSLCCALRSRTGTGRHWDHAHFLQMSESFTLGHFSLFLGCLLRIT